MISFNKAGRKKKLLINTLVSALSEIVAMACGLILPRLILSNFGSDYNGMISSITQIISFVTLLRSGVGGVTRAALYKPLAEKDIDSISSIIKATELFMRKIAIIFILISLILACFYPLLTKDFDWLFTFVLFLVLSLTTFIQYQFGITYQMLLMADQRQYIFTAFNIISVILNTILSYILIKMGFSIIIVKLGSTVAFAMTPILLKIYVNRMYKLNRNAKPNNIALKQRWDALGHQISYYILTSTDLTVLTILANVKYVSVYSVYYLVIKAIKMIIKTYSSSVEAAFGNIIAKNQSDKLRNSFSLFECFMFISCNFLFSCTLILIVPFVKVYTTGIVDTNYYQPLFSVLLVFGEMIYCLRIPYMSVVESAGKYRETKNGAYFEAFINILVSIILCFYVNPLVAVATGTLISLSIRTIEISYFADTHIVKRSRKFFYKNVLLSMIIMLLSYLICSKISIIYECTTYLQWGLSAIIVILVVSIILILVVLVFYKRAFILLFRSLKQTLVKS